MRVAEVCRRRHLRIAGALGQQPVGGAAADLGEVRGVQVVGVAQNRVGHGTERGEQTEVLRPLVAKRDHELADVLADVLDVMQ